MKTRRIRSGAGEINAQFEEFEKKCRLIGTELGFRMSLSSHCDVAREAQQSTVFPTGAYAGYTAAELAFQDPIALLTKDLVGEMRAECTTGEERDAVDDIEVEVFSVALDLRHLRIPPIISSTRSVLRYELNIPAGGLHSVTVVPAEVTRATSVPHIFHDSVIDFSRVIGLPPRRGWRMLLAVWKMLVLGDAKAVVSKEYANNYFRMVNNVDLEPKKFGCPALAEVLADDSINQALPGVASD